MFEKFESWNFSSPTPAELFPSAWNFWTDRSYRLVSTGPTSFQGKSFHSRLGLHRVLDVTVLPSGSGTLVQLRYRADVTEAGAAGGVIAAVVLFPVAVVGGALSWHTYEKDFQEERWAFWNHLTGSLKATPAQGTHAPAPPSVAPPPPPPPPSSGTASPPPPPPPPPASGPPGLPDTSVPQPASPICQACGKPLAGEAKFCASCGAPAK